MSVQFETKVRYEHTGHSHAFDSRQQHFWYIGGWKLLSFAEIYIEQSNEQKGLFQQKLMTIMFKTSSKHKHFFIQISL